MDVQQRNLDYLYERIATQKLRVDTYNCKKTKLSPQSCWNNDKLEKKILTDMIKQYKSFLIKRAEHILNILETIKNDNVNSYMTYNKQFYETEFQNYKKEIENYKDKVILSPPSSITSIDFSKISENINKLYSNILVKPTLFSQI